MQQSVIDFKESVIEFKEWTIRHFEAQIAEMRQQLEPMEAGTVFTKERRDGGPWVDTTQSDIERLRRHITEYERCVALLENQLREV
jgi:hypothetical protein